MSAGRVIGGRFTLLEKLGSGGFGEVWRARDGEGGREVAVKIMHQVHRANARVLERFAVEAKVLARLEHPGLPRAIACAPDAEPPFLAMELIQGRPLSELLREHSLRGALLDGLSIRALFEAIVAVVEHAHAMGVVHRDLKPANVLVRALEPGRAELSVLDFGIAKILDAGAPSEATTKGRVVGSLLHLSPEQIAGEPVDARSDVFALATMLFEVLTLRQPWIVDGADRPARLADDGAQASAANDHFQVLQRIARLPRPRARELRAAIPRALEEALSQGLSTRARDRFASAAEFLGAIAGGLEELARAEETSLVEARVETDRVPPTMIAEVSSAETRPAAGQLALAFLAGACVAVVITVFALRRPAGPARVEPEPEPERVRVRMEAPPPSAVPQPVTAEDGAMPEPDLEPQPSKRPRVAATRATNAALAVKPSEASALEQLRVKLETDPRNAALITEVSAEVVARARRLADRALAASIERRATSAALAFDAQALERCIGDLEREAAKRR